MRKPSKPGKTSKPRNSSSTSIPPQPAPYANMAPGRIARQQRMLTEAARPPATSSPRTTQRQPAR